MESPEKKLVEWQKDVYNLYVSENDQYGKKIEIGTNGFGEYLIKADTVTDFITRDVFEAVKYYNELVNAK